MQPPVPPPSDAPARVTVFDTTLRDGEQSPGASLDAAQKLQVARALAALGVDVVELGFPAASPGDFRAVQRVARAVEGPVMCALARCTLPDIEAAAEALCDAARRRLHVFLATSPLHREHKLRMSRAEVVRRAVEGVRRALERCEDVQFSAEDAARTEPDFLAEVAERVVEAGARTFNVPDTVGYAVPAQFAALVALLRRTVRGLGGPGGAVLSVHCHDDLGLALANSLAALGEGARQVECTINGLGERAGNCALEEVVMALRTRRDALGLTTGVRTERLLPTSRLVSGLTGMVVARNKAVVGQNAFAHESGIHQHGMLAHRATYEVMRPEDVGVTTSSLVLGKHSGRHVLRARVAELGYVLDADALDRLFEAFKALADRKKEVLDADLEALVQAQLGAPAEPTWTLESLGLVSGPGTVPTATVCLAGADGRRVRDAACGDGPVDAVFKVMVRLTGLPARLCGYQVSAVTEGEDAQGQVTVELEHQGHRTRGRATSTDVVEGSARAVLEALNRLTARARLAPQPAASPLSA